MDSHNPYEQAIRHFKTAVRELRRLQVLPTPIAVLVWFCHASGQYPDLSRQIAGHAADPAGLGDERIQALFDQHFGTRPEQIDDIARRIETMLLDAADSLESAARRGGSYGEELASFRHTLMTETGVRTLHLLVMELVVKTKLMQDDTDQLQRRLLDSCAVAASLREDLELAQTEACRDGLTGIANRRAFELELVRLAAAARRDEQPLAVLMIDVDHFQRFNASHGPAMGDQLLRLVAETIVGSVKGRDLVARTGGDEFGVILPRTRLADALTVAAQIERSIAASPLVLRQSRRSLGTVTVSIGGAEYRPGEPASHLVARADKALRRAKAAGRNRAMASDDDAAGETGVTATLAASA